MEPGINALPMETDPKGKFRIGLPSIPDVIKALVRLSNGARY